MKCGIIHHSAAALVCAACTATALSDDVCGDILPVAGVRHVMLGAEGGIAASTPIYDDTQPGQFFTITNTPRWHCGEPASFSPGPAAGLTNVVVTRMTITVGNNSGAQQTCDIHVALWDTYNASVGAGLAVNSDLISEFTIVGAVLEDTFAYFYTVDLSGFPGGGITMPDDAWFYEVHYYETGTTNPQLLVSPVFNAGPDTTGDGVPDGPTVGSSQDMFFRDGNGNGILSSSSPNERGRFTNNKNLANFAIRLEAELCGPCDTNCDGTVNQFDINSFISAIVAHHGCSACAADTNGDGTANTFDINGFIRCLAP